MLPATSTQGIDTAGLDQAISPEQLVAGVTSLDGSVAYSYDAQGQLVAATYSPSLRERVRVRAQGEGESRRSPTNRIRTMPTATAPVRPVPPRW